MLFALGRKVVNPRMAHDQRDVVNMTESPGFFSNPSYYMTMNNFATSDIPRYAPPAPPCAQQPDNFNGEKVPC